MKNKEELEWQAVTRTVIAGKVMLFGIILLCSMQSAAQCNNASTRQVNARRGVCCCKKYWDYYPRPELNPPDDISTLPDIEQQRFCKIFREVPETIKSKSTQNYRERMIFMRSPQYVSITNKLAVKLARATGKKLAQYPAVSPDDVLKMCFDTIVYGRSLIMGKMENGTFFELAGRYGFKNAGKEVEKIENKRNFGKKAVGAYPIGDPECRDFAVLAEKANASRWKDLLARNVALGARNASDALANKDKKQMFDIYDERTSRALPEDFSSLPNRMRVKMGKMYDLLPVQVLAMSARSYRQRAAYVTSAQYAKVRGTLEGKLSKAVGKISSDPAVTVAEVVKLADEMVRFGRPLVAGDLRAVSLQQLASRHGYDNVEKFVRIVEDSQYARSGKSMVWPSAQPEFRDFALLASALYKDRWLDFLARVQAPSRTSASALSQRRWGGYAKCSRVGRNGSANR